MDSSVPLPSVSNYASALLYLQYLRAVVYGTVVVRHTYARDATKRQYKIVVRCCVKDLDEKVICRVLAPNLFALRCID